MLVGRRLSQTKPGGPLRHVEQQNWTLVRRLIGHQGLDTPDQLEWLDSIYTDLLRP